MNIKAASRTGRGTLQRALSSRRTAIPASSFSADLELYFRAVLSQSSSPARKVDTETPGGELGVGFVFYVWDADCSLADVAVL